MNRRENLKKVEEQYEWNKWAEEIPFLNFREDWQVKIIPPYAIGIVRFLVKKGDAQVSVYLDCYDMAGYVREPYWEIYPHEYRDFDVGEMDGMWECSRYYLHETEDLVEGIKESFENQLKKDQEADNENN